MVVLAPSILRILKRNSRTLKDHWNGPTQRLWFSQKELVAWLMWHLKNSQVSFQHLKFWWSKSTASETILIATRKSSMILWSILTRKKLKIQWNREKLWKWQRNSCRTVNSLVNWRLSETSNLSTSRTQSMFLASLQKSSTQIWCRERNLIQLMLKGLNRFCKHRIKYKERSPICKLEWTFLTMRSPRQIHLRIS